jgi:hypothetical protein
MYGRSTDILFTIYILKERKKKKKKKKTSTCTSTTIVIINGWGIECWYE